MTKARTVVVSGAPGSGKSTVASALAERLELPLLSLDEVKEALADELGLGDEPWSNRLGDAAAEVIFRLVSSAHSGVVVEGWWRRDRRDRAIREFQGCTEVFCRCEPDVAHQRATTRLRQARHPIHRDVINPAMLDDLAQVAGTVRPLQLGATLIEVDTTDGYDIDELTARVAAAIAERE